MCGICGYINLDKQPVQDSRIIEEMTRTLIHRGPDDEGFYINENVALGMRRLEIIDLNTGHQPIHNEDKSIWVIFNGEIYNYQLLTEDLKNKGHLFYTNSDTEVIVHLYEDFKQGCVRYLEGMFSFCIYDSKEKLLFFARDRLGEKPFYYYFDKNIFAFGSEVKAILKHPFVRKELDLVSFNKYLLYGYIPSPSSIFKNIKKLQAAHTLTFKTNSNLIYEIKKYWEQSFKLKVAINENDLIYEIRERLKKSIRFRLVSDVPIGVLLSGGVDSSIVVMLMNELLPSNQIKTFSIGFCEKQFDESFYARIIANKFRTDHNEKIVSADSALEVMPEIFEKLDEPMSDPSIIPTYLINKFAHQYVKVALSGDGGDELFAGYPKYIILKYLDIYRLLPKTFGKIGNSLIKRIFRKFNNPQIIKFIETLDYSPKLRNQLWVSAFLPQQLPNLINKDLCISQELVLEDLNKHISLFDGIDNLDRAFFLDTVMNLQDFYLVKMDRASMMNSLEVRTPFLDYELVQYTSNISSNLKTKGFKTKYLLKKLALQNIPKPIIYRKKMGFGIPLAQWLRSKLASKTIRLKNEGNLFNIQYVSSIIDEHFSGSRDNSGKLWSLIVFKEWFSKWMH